MQTMRGAARINRHSGDEERHVKLLRLESRRGSLLEVGSDARSVLNALQVSAEQRERLEAFGLDSGARLEVREHDHIDIAELVIDEIISAALVAQQILEVGQPPGQRLAAEGLGNGVGFKRRLEVRGGRSDEIGVGAGRQREGARMVEVAVLVLLDRPVVLEQILAPGHDHLCASTAQRVGGHEAATLGDELQDGGCLGEVDVALLASQQWQTAEGERGSALCRQEVGVRDRGAWQSRAT